MKNWLYYEWPVLYMYSKLDATTSCSVHLSSRKVVKYIPAILEGVVIGGNVLSLKNVIGL